MNSRNARKWIIAASLRQPMICQGSVLRFEQIRSADHRLPELRVARDGVRPVWRRATEWKFRLQLRARALSSGGAKPAAIALESRGPGSLWP
jgi:hypothetical protein